MKKLGDTNAQKTEMVRKNPVLHTPYIHKKDTSWGNVATWYDDVVTEKDSYQGTVILPNLLRLVNPKSGSHVLDVACGQGFFSGAFIAKGAHVTGVDVAPELIAIAKEKYGTSALADFRVSSSHRLTFIPTETIDGATMVLAAQNIRECDLAFEEIARTLKRGGTFSLVLNHPSFRNPKKSEWGYDDKRKLQYRRIEGYLNEHEEVIDMNPSKKGSKDSKTTISFHRPLQWYAKHLTKHGLVIDRIEEWTSNKTSVGKRAAAENKARKEFPLFLYLRTIKQ